MIKWQRNWYAKISTIPKGYGPAFNPEFVTVGYPLTLDFSVNRNTMGGIQEAEFTIYDLGANTRKLIQKNTIDLSPDNIRTIEVYAGYGARTLPLLFKGLILTCGSVREEGSPEWETSISCQDPGLFNSGNEYLTVTPQMTKAYGIQQVVNKMNSDSQGLISLGLVSPYFKQNNFLGNNAFSGSYLDILQKITGGNLSGGNFFFENQVLHALQQDEAFENNGVPILNSENGLLGAPWYEQTWVFANWLFEPRIKMGQIINLKSENNAWLNGQKKLVAYTHSGTISGSVAGKCQTQVQLFATLNSQGFQIIGGEAAA